MAKKSKKQRAKQRQPEARPESAIRLRAQPDPGTGPQPQPWAAPSVPPAEGPTASAPVVEAPTAEAPAPEAAVPEEAAPEPEHRSSQRVAVSVDIHLASDSHFFSGLSGDISEGGLFLSTYRPLPIGSEVDLEFSLPGSEETLHARGEVRWLREHSVHEPRGVGIAFGALSEHDRERIHRFCTMRPPLYYEDVG